MKILIKKALQIEFFRFLVVGAINTLFGYLIFSGILFLTQKPYLSIVLATVIGTIFNFKTYGRIVFKSKDNTLIYRFFGVYLLVMLIQMLLIKVFSFWGINNAYIAAAIITIPMAILSYTLMNKLVFKNQTI